MRKFIGIALLVSCMVWSCAGFIPGIMQGIGKKASTEERQISATGKIGPSMTPVPLPMYLGNGGLDIRLAVMAPEAENGVPDYLPLFVQGLLNSNFRKYSAIFLTERQNLEKLISDQKIGANGKYSEKDLETLAEWSNAQYFLTGLIQVPAKNTYSLQLFLTDTNTQTRKAVYQAEGALAQFTGNGELVNQAAMNVLDQMQVAITDAGKEALLAGNSGMASTEASLARGIAAQAKSDFVDAVFSYAETLIYDSSREEAMSRLNALSSIISGGNIGPSLGSEQEIRNKWISVFTKTTEFFDKHPPFEIAFDPYLVTEKAVDPVNNVTDLGMRVILAPSVIGFNVLNTLLEGLEKSGNRKNWGFSGWPIHNLDQKKSKTVVFGGKSAFSYKIDASLVNENSKTISKSNITLNTQNLDFANGDLSVKIPGGDMEVLLFANVKADDLTPALTITINSINGVAVKNLNARGYNMRIYPDNLEERFPINPASAIPDNLALIRGGFFTMGSPENEPERSGIEDPQHRVTLRSFYMGKHPVTQKEYQEVMGENPSANAGSNYPVDTVSWYDAVEFCNRLSQKEGLKPVYTINKEASDSSNTSAYDNVKWQVSWDRTANGYRLPTEAEWEYACRAGTSTPFSTGRNITTSQANYDGNYPYDNNEKGASLGQTSPVDKYEPNPWGLHDMHGNVREWCWDWYGSYTDAAQVNPQGPAVGSYRVDRGGSWNLGGQYLRSAGRGSITASTRDNDLGFRVIRP
ncbi:MAG: formylglycine-generating enzyme family protein [Treponema sp.]|nr:formylglycine-generating enzyme family protein [Treponema sp.]